MIHTSKKVRQSGASLRKNKPMEYRRTIEFKCHLPSLRKSIGPPLVISLIVVRLLAKELISLRYACAFIQTVSIYTLRMITLTLPGTGEYAAK